MARYVGPQCRLCRAEKTKLFLKGSRCNSPKCPINKKRSTPGKAPRARAKKPSDYGLQLREKQKLKRIYGMLEKQFYIFFERAENMQGKTGDNLVSLLEKRLDNMVYRMCYASSRKQARQIIRHGHILVNGQRVSIPSYMVKEGDVISIAEKSKAMTLFKEALKEYGKSGIVPWLSLDPDKMEGKVNAIPRRGEITELSHVNEQLIVELYSK